jgi:hypothetical protein
MRLVNTNNKSLRTGGELAKNEKNDCTVKSIMSAFDCSYVEAHRFCQSRLHRKHQQGVFNFGTLTSKQAYDCVELNGRKLRVCKSLPFRPSVERINEFFGKKGTFLIIVEGHCLCIKNGIEYNNSTSDVNSEVMGVWEVVTINEDRNRKFGQLLSL